MCCVVLCFAADFFFFFFLAAAAFFLKARTRGEKTARTARSSFCVAFFSSHVDLIPFQIPVKDPLDKIWRVLQPL